METTDSSWTPLEPDIDTILARSSEPLEELASGRIPAVVFRDAWPVVECRRLVDRLIAEDLLYDPSEPVPDRFVPQSIPEGFYREGRQVMPANMPTSRGERRRIDIGTSLGYRGSDQDSFFEHAAETQQLFARLFAGEPDPVRRLYERLESLAGGRRVVTAHEADGRQYGPAIIRAHYGGYTYAPHFDSVRLREKRSDYAVSEFEHQFAGVLVLQNTCDQDKTAQCLLHRCLWEPDVNAHLGGGRFHDYARNQGIPNVEVCLEPGDLYFFNTRLIHEVPGVAGELPRVVLATFIGYSADRRELFVWS